MSSVCIECNKTPDQLDEYVDMARLQGTTPEEFVRSEEGTYNEANGHFACTSCYIKMGMPTTSGGWVAP